MAYKGALSNLFPVPVGAIIFSANPLSVVPENYLLADGSAVDKDEYPELYSVIGGLFGEVGNTFNLPDLISSPFIKGDSVVNPVPFASSIATSNSTATLVSANLPSLSAGNFGAGSLGTSSGNISGNAIERPAGISVSAGAIGSAVKADSTSGQFSASITVDATNGVVEYSNTAQPVAVNIVPSSTPFEPQNIGLLPLIRAKNLLPLNTIANTSTNSPPTQGYIL